MAAVAEEDSFLLCDARVSGYPIRHVSQGFKELFRLAQGETASRAENLQSCSGLLESQEALAALAQRAGLRPEECSQALVLLEGTAANACRAVVAGEVQARSMLLLKSKRGGDLFVCLVSIALHRHPKTAWSFLAGLHKDVTSQVPLAALLSAARAGPEALQELLTHLQAGQQEEKVRSPGSALRFQEDFEQAWRGFVSGQAQALGLAPAGSREGSNSGSIGSGTGSGKHSAGKKQKGKTARSEVSAATTASNVSFRRKASREEEVLDQEESSQLSYHLLELLEPVGAGHEPKRSRREPPGGRRVTVVEDHKDLGLEVKGLRDLDFPFAIFDPSQPGLPATVCSSSMSELMDGVEKLSLSDLFAGMEDMAEREAVLGFCDAAVRGDYFFRSGKHGFQEYPTEGELVCEAKVKRAGALGEFMVYLKQVELEDKMYILCLQASLVDLRNEEAPERRRLVYLCLDARLDVLLQVLAANFWFSAPMRRQVTAGDGRSLQGCPLLSCI